MTECVTYRGRVSFQNGGLPVAPGYEVLRHHFLSGNSVCMSRLGSVSMSVFNGNLQQLGYLVKQPICATIAEKTETLRKQRKIFFKTVAQEIFSTGPLMRQPFACRSVVFYHK